MIPTEAAPAPVEPVPPAIEPEPSPAIEPKPAPAIEPKPAPAESAPVASEAEVTPNPEVTAPTPASTREPPPKPTIPAVAPIEDESAGYGRRTRAVDAYCRELFAPAIPTGVAQQILESLTQAIRDDHELLATTRTAAAALLSSDGTDEHAETPSLLAARANGSLTEDERAHLDEHLDSCLVCRAAELRAARADRAFAGVIGLTLTTTRR